MMNFHININIRIHPKIEILVYVVYPQYPPIHLDLTRRLGLALVKELPMKKTPFPKIKP